MYLSKKIERLLNNFDQNTSLPNGFFKYSKKIESNHRLIIKDKTGYHCNYCNNVFDKAKIIEQYSENYARCPHCKKQLVLKTSRIRKYCFKDWFAVLNRYEDYFILRCFEIVTWFNSENYESDICEFSRVIYDSNFKELAEVYNDNVTVTIGGKLIRHIELINYNWKQNGSYYHRFGDYYMLFTTNLKKELKDTKWQYCQLNNFAKHFDYFHIESFMIRTPRTMEMLIKNKLYNIAKDLISEYDSYLVRLDQRFILKHLNFIQKNKLGLKELETMDYIGYEDVNLIKKYSNYHYDFERIKNIKIDFKLADQLVLDLFDNFYEYCDYLRICNELGYDLSDKKILYPKSAHKSHNKIVKLYDLIKSQKYNKAIHDRYEKIKSNIYKNKKFIIFPASSSDDLIEESNQQHNCVKTYASRIASGECDIYFMRLITKPKNSLVTVEVKDNKIVQKRTKFNKITTEEQDKFLKKWEGRLV